MTLAYCTYSSVQVNTVLIPAQPGKLIRVARIVATTWASMKVTFMSDPGSDPQYLTPPLHLGAVGLNLDLGRAFALVTGRGKALGFNASFQVSPAEFSLAVWYEVVN